MKLSLIKIYQREVEDARGDGEWFVVTDHSHCHKGFSAPVFYNVLTLHLCCYFSCLIKIKLPKFSLSVLFLNKLAFCLRLRGYFSYLYYEHSI